MSFHFYPSKNDFIWCGGIIKMKLKEGDSLMDSKGNISIIISTYNNKKGLYNIIKSLISNSSDIGEIIIVNHCGEKVDFIKEDFIQLNISIIDMLSPVSLAYGINKAIAYSKSDYIVILKDSDMVSKAYIDRLISFMGIYDIIYPMNKKTIYGVLYKKEVHQNFRLFNVGNEKWDEEFFSLLVSNYKINYS